MPQQREKGIHLLAELFECEENVFIKFKKNILEKEVSSLNKKYNFRELGSYYHDFDSGGVTGIVALVESHVAIHTWPEDFFVTLDIFICNYKNDNTENAKLLFKNLVDLFKPHKIKTHILLR